MGLISQEVFVCVDCETTGLDTTKDRIIEIAAVKFTFNGIIDSKETLVNPEMTIPAESITIHNIAQEMVEGKPKIAEVLPEFLKFIGRHIIVGHGIPFDIAIITKEAERSQIPCKIGRNPFVDTLRLARLYGESPVNSLEILRRHFNIEEQNAHRAMSDVQVNIEVFKKLSQKFKTTKELLSRLEKPILLKNMPLGQHKGRLFKEIPLQYLLWAAGKNFDQDLLYSIRREIKQRKNENGFNRSSNPFSTL